MNSRSLSVLAFSIITAALAGCTSNTADASASAPVIDGLDVPAQTSTLTVQGQSGPGFVLTLTAHDDHAGIASLHVVFTEVGQEQTIEIPNAPTKIDGQKIELVIANVPKGDHPLGFYLVDSEGNKSTTVDKTITVP